MKITYLLLLILALGIAASYGMRWLTIHYDDIRPPERDTVACRYLDDNDVMVTVYVEAWRCAQWESRRGTDFVGDAWK